MRVFAAEVAASAAQTRLGGLHGSSTSQAGHATVLPSLCIQSTSDLTMIHTVHALSMKPWGHNDQPPHRTRVTQDSTQAMLPSHMGLP